MRLHRFYVKEPIVGKEIVIKDRDLLHQWKNVFRLNVGSQVILFSGDGLEHRVTLVALQYYDIRALVLETAENPIALKRNVHLYISLPKKDKFEWVCEKGTELGVLHFHPIISERSEKKNLNPERAQKIILEALEQSGRAFMPKLYPLLSLGESLRDVVTPAFVLDKGGNSFSDVFEKREESETVSFFVGPEGGWSERDLLMFREKSIETISLGQATLRAETAAMSLAALLLL